MSLRVREILPATRLDIAPFIMGIHYAKRWPSISKSWKLVVDGVIEGIVCYGRPSSSTLRTGVCGCEFQVNVWELNRLCLKSNVKNDASWLVAHSLKLMGDSVIVSYADTSAGHIGYVYQACGFTYTGLSAKRTDWHVSGMEGKHGQTISDEFRGKSGRSLLMREKYGDLFSLVDRSRKHRYVKIIGCRKFKKVAMAALRYPEQPYPKEDQ